MLTTKTDHPKGLYFLCFTEMWERFSYFGMRALLVYYMTKHLLFSQEYASHIYGLYTGLIYFTPFLGGIVADRFLGKHKSVVIGAILMSVGHFLMAIKSMFFPALLFLIIGCGAFSPNINTQVGDLYKPGDHRRDRAFSLFYLGINAGAVLSPLICGTLGEIYGWHYGFAAAGIGMLIGLTTYLIGQKYLPLDQLEQRISNPQIKEKNQNIGNKAFWFVTLMLFATLFNAVYAQQGNTMALWIDANTNRHIFGWEMPASWFQSFNPFLIIILTPFVTSLWGLQEKQNREPSNIVKMAMGCIIMGVSYLLMIPAALTSSSSGGASLFWPTAWIFILTIGELYFRPVALSLVTKISSPKIVSMMMGIWFLSYFAGYCLSGFIGGFWEKMPKELFFVMLSVIVIGAGIGMLTVLKPLKRALNYNPKNLEPDNLLQQDTAF